MGREASFFPGDIAFYTSTPWQIKFYRGRLHNQQPVYYAWLFL